MPYADKDKQREYQRKWMRSPEQAKKQNARNKEMYQTLSAFVNERKKDPCMDCGQKFHPVVMDFDHRPGETKVKSIADLVAWKVKPEVLVEEMNKCDLVCANCHRLRTHERQQGRKNG